MLLICFYPSFLSLFEYVYTICMHVWITQRLWVSLLVFHSIIQNYILSLYRHPFYTLFSWSLIVSMFYIIYACLVKLINCTILSAIIFVTSLHSLYIFPVYPKTEDTEGNKASSHIKVHNISRQPWSSLLSSLGVQAHFL